MDVSSRIGTRLSPESWKDYKRKREENRANRHREEYSPRSARDVRDERKPYLVRGISDGDPDDRLAEEPYRHCYGGEEHHRGAGGQRADRLLESARGNRRHYPYWRPRLDREKDGERQEYRKSERADRRQHVLERPAKDEGDDDKRKLDDVTFHSG